MKQFSITHNGIELTGKVTLGGYASGQNLIQLFDEDGSPYATVSVSIPTGLTRDEVAIKNHSENEGMADSLLAHGVIVGEPVCEVPSGFVTIPVYKLAKEIIS